MTRDTSAFRFSVTAHVLRMIETDVKAFFEAIGEAFAGRVAAIDGLVADRAHRDVRRGELRQVTTGAILVSGETGSRRVVSAMMTVRADERCVLRTGVREFRIVLIAGLRSRIAHGHH